MNPSLQSSKVNITLDKWERERGRRQVVFLGGIGGVVLKRA